MSFGKHYQLIFCSRMISLETQSCTSRALLDVVVSFGINLGPNFEITNAIVTRANVLSLQNYPLQTKIAKIPVMKMDSI